MVGTAKTSDSERIALLEQELEAACRSARYVAESPLMRAVLAKVELVAPSDSTVLIRGETGTGKEGLAHLIHAHSRRAGQPFVPVRLGAIPAERIQGELFGPSPDSAAKTGGMPGGKFEQAAGGTLFLDEVGHLPLLVQAQLTRVLQERESERPGSGQRGSADVRVIAATSRPLERMVESGELRSDLYYRLAIFPVNLPPLRERREDIRPLVGYFLARHALRMNRRSPSVPEPVWQALEAARWPGNVRELENLIERALIRDAGPVLVLPDLALVGPAAAGAPAAATAQAPAGSAARVAPEAEAPLRRFDVVVRELLRRALDQAGGHIYGPRGAAALLGLRPTTLQGKLRKYGVTRGSAGRSEDER